MADELAPLQRIESTRAFSSNARFYAPKHVDALDRTDLASWYARDRHVVLDVLRALGRFAS